MNTNVFSCTRYHRTSSNCPRVSGLSISSTKYRQHSAEHLSHKQPFSIGATPYPPPPDPDKVSRAARQAAGKAKGSRQKAKGNPRDEPTLILLPFALCLLPSTAVPGPRP